LGRIKKTSYYQRNKKPETPTPGEEAKPIVGASSSANNSSGANTEPNGHKTKWIGFEEGDKFRDLNEEEAGTDQASSVAATQQPIEEDTEQQPEEFNRDFEQQDENEDDEDIFNTEYVDVATSGELKLAYVPDSPTLEAAAGDDPFDTSDVEKLVGPLPVIKKKKALVSIGAAVEILTAANAADQQQKQNHQVSTASRQRIVQPPREIQLLCCFDDNEVDQKHQSNSLAVTPLTNQHAAESSSVQQTPHSEVLLEEELITSGEPDLKDILAEFDVIPENADQPIDDEFVKPPKPTPVQPKKPELLDEEDFEFEALAYESLAKQPLPQEEEEEEDDPFDTSSVDKVLNKDKGETSIISKKAPPTRPVAPPSRPPPPPSASAIAAIAAAINRPSTAPARPAAPANNPITVPPLQAQDSFDALFLNESPTEKEKLAEKKSEDPIQSPSADPFNTSSVDPFDTSAVDPFDTSAVDPFDTSAVDPFDTLAVNSLDISAVGNTSVTNQSPVLAAEPQLQVTSFVLLDDSPIEDEVDPFDTSAVEKILN
jgi:hypothetical protein